MDKTKACILPWISLFGSIEGYYKICCEAEVVNSSDFQNPIIGPKDSDLKELWNSAHYKKLRKDMLAGHLPRECVETCIQKENSGEKSSRIRYNEMHSQHLALLDQTNEDGSLDFAPRRLDIRFGNLCNFKCRMCGPYSSHIWDKEWEQLHGNKLDYNQGNPWGKGSHFWRQLEYLAPHLEEIHFGGGEPLMLSDHYELLQFLIDNNYVDIKLRYNTNLSVLKFGKRSALEQWKKFKNVSLLVSCDAVGEVGEYIRKGFRWSEFQEKFYLAREFVDSIAATVQIENIFHLPELINWCLEKEIPFFGNILSEPSYLSIQNLPIEEKNKIRDFYSQYIENSNPPEHIVKNINSWLEFMGDDDRSMEFETFISKSKKLNEIRGESLVEVLPEFQSYL